MLIYNKTLASSLPTLNLARYMGHTQHGGVGKCRIIESTAPGQIHLAPWHTYAWLLHGQSPSWRAKVEYQPYCPKQELWNSSLSFHVDFYIIFTSKNFTTQTTSSGWLFTISLKMLFSSMGSGMYLKLATCQTFFATIITHFKFSPEHEEFVRGICNWRGSHVQCYNLDRYTFPRHQDFLLQQPHYEQSLHVISGLIDF